MQDNAFLGQGWAFPIRFLRPDFVQLQSGEGLIRQSMRLILATLPGERAMRPDFGSQLNRALFDGVDGRTLHNLEHSVQDALSRFEPRIDINDVAALAGDEAGQVWIRVDYTVRETNTRNNLVYPFWLTEAAQ
nr:GPW/gp25 family protein [Chromobacterium sp. ASV5]